MRCPNCGAEDQEAGKYCENCGRLLTAADAQAGASNPPTTPTRPDPNAAAPPAGQGPSAGAGTAVAGAVAGTATATAAPAAPLPAGPRAQFAVVGASGADPSQGFTIRQVGEFLVGRPNAETGVNPDIDLRQWVQTIEIGGQHQYLVHRCQCYLGLAADGTATIRACPGAEVDTLVKPAGQATFVPLQQFGTVRPSTSGAAEGTYPLQAGDQIYMGDPEALRYFQTGDPTARGSYLVLELINPTSAP